MARHAGSPRPSDLALADRARACAADIRAWTLHLSDLGRPGAGLLVDPAAERAAEARLLGRALAILEEITETR